jgi:hypothetical protein
MRWLARETMPVSFKNCRLRKYELRENATLFASFQGDNDPGKTVPLYEIRTRLDLCSWTFGLRSLGMRIC